MISRLWYRSRATSLVAAVSLALVSAVFAAASANSTVRKLFEDAAKGIAKRTSVEIYVPITLQSLSAAATDGCAFSESKADSYDISIYGRLVEHGKTDQLPCEASNAALLAQIHGDTKAMPDRSKARNAQRVMLRNGMPGWFIPVACGGSCAPATLYWQTPKASYWLQLRLESHMSKETQRSELLEIADSMQLISAEH